MLELRPRGRHPVLRDLHEPLHVLLQLRKPCRAGDACSAADGALEGGHGGRCCRCCGLPAYGSISTRKLGFVGVASLLPMQPGARIASHNRVPLSAGCCFLLVRSLRGYLCGRPWANGCSSQGASWFSSSQTESAGSPPRLQHLSSRDQSKGNRTSSVLGGKSTGVTRAHDCKLWLLLPSNVGERSVFL